MPESFCADLLEAVSYVTFTLRGDRGRRSLCERQPRFLLQSLSSVASIMTERHVLPRLGLADGLDWRLARRLKMQCPMIDQVLRDLARFEAMATRTPRLWPRMRCRSLAGEILTLCDIAYPSEDRASRVEAIDKGLWELRAGIHRWYPNE